MKKMIIIIIMSVLLAIGFTAYAKSGECEYYGRSMLANLQNGENLVEVYDIIADSVKQMSEESIQIDTAEISSTELRTVYNAFRNDHPEVFWLGTAFSYSSYQDIIKTFTPSYTMTKSEVQKNQNLFDKAINEFLSCVDDTMSDEEIALNLHDKIANRVVYAESEQAHSAYGALVNGVSVCEGYGRAYQLLLNEMGIKCLCVTGHSGESHLWNKVNLNGSWVNVDVTWDDLADELFHFYFAGTDEDFADHTPDILEYDLPECTDASYKYFDEKNTFATLKTDKIVSLFKKGLYNGIAQCEFLYTGATDIWQWISTNFGDIADRLEMEGQFSIRLTHVEDEYHLKIINTSDTVLKGIIVADDLDFSIYKNTGENILAVAEYNGIKLNDLKFIKNPECNGFTGITIKDGYTYKLFLWENLLSVMPVCKIWKSN